MAFSTLIYYKQDQQPSSLCQDSHGVPVGLTQADGDQYFVYYDENQAISVDLGNNATLSELSAVGIQIAADTFGSPVPPGSYASGPFDGTQISDTVVFDQNLTEQTTTCPVTASIVGFSISSISVTETNATFPIPIPVSLTLTNTLFPCFFAS